MTTTDTTTRTAVPRRELTQAEFLAEGTTLFGPDMRSWAFQCPTCGGIATAADFPPGQGELAPVECLGRYGVEGRCKRVAYGFIPGPWFVRQHDGAVVACFPFGPAPSQAPHAASQDPDDTGGPGSVEAPPDAAVRTACGLSVERRQVAGFPDAEHWHYRVALGEQQSVLGYRDKHRADPPVTLTFVDSAAPQGCEFHELAPDFALALRHIAAYDVPVTEADLTHAVLLIVEACAEDTATRTDEPAAPKWLPMDEAPEDGTEIIGLLNGDEVPIRWNDGDRHCAGTGVALGAGYGFGPGWEDTWNNYAVIDEVEGWRPVDPGTESEA